MCGRRLYRLHSYSFHIMQWYEPSVRGTAEVSCEESQDWEICSKLVYALLSICSALHGITRHDTILHKLNTKSLDSWWPIGGRHTILMQSHARQAEGHTCPLTYLHWTAYSCAESVAGAGTDRLSRIVPPSPCWARRFSECNLQHPIRYSFRRRFWNKPQVTESQRAGTRAMFSGLSHY